MEKACIVSCFYSQLASSRELLIREVIQKQYNVEIITTDFNHSQKKYRKPFEENDIKCLHVLGYKKNFSIKRILSHLGFGYKALYLIQKLQPALVYILLPPNFVARLVAKYCKKKNIICIVDVIDIWPNVNVKRNTIRQIPLKIWSNLRNSAIHNASKVILECSLYKEYISCADFAVLPLAKTYYNFSIIPKHKTSKILNIGYLGAISSSYDFSSLIYLAENVKNWKINLCIIGTGEQESCFLEKLDKKHIPYEFYGTIYEEEKKSQILKECDFGFNGFAQGMIVGQSYKSLDYYSYGLPLINSLKSDTGLVIETYNSGINYSITNRDELVKKIDSLTVNNLEELKTNARNVFLTQFYSTIFIKNLTKIIFGESK